MKTLALALTVCALALTMTACSGSTCKLGIPGGTNPITVSIDTSDGYKLKQTADFDFVIEKDGTEIVEGSTLSNELIGVAKLNIGYGNTLLDEGTRDGYEYFFYRSDVELMGEILSSEWVYVISLPDSPRGIQFTNYESQESAEECFKRMTISK